MRPDLEVIARGRDADIYRVDRHRVLRRSREGRRLDEEAAVMVHARAAGFPVPRVDDVSADGTEVLMEFVPGPTMADAMAADPGSVVARSERLAELSADLHTIAAPAWLGPGPVEPGPCLVHLDLHPLNVIESPEGPVVIDWANAARGSARVDAAVSWLLLATGGDGGRGLGVIVDDDVRDAAVDRFAHVMGERDVRHVLAAVVAWRVLDRNVRSEESAAARRFSEERLGAGGGEGA